MKKNMKPFYGLMLILLIAAFSLLIHLLTYDILGFHRDELLYLALGRHFAAGYWSNPPLIGLISLISQLLPLDPLLATRILPAVAGAILVVIVGLMTRELGGGIYAQVFACLSITLSLLMLRGFSMLQPVPFDILFWTLILYWFLRYINSEKPVFIILMGIGLGLGIMNKYMVLFLAAGLMLAVLLTPHRKLWINKYTWYAALIAVILVIPNLVWQYNHGFPVINHITELRDTQLVNVKRANILIDQLLMFTFSSLVWLTGLLFLLFSPRAKSFRVFGFVYLIVLLMFVILRGKSYYTAGLYAFLFAAGGVGWEGVLKTVKHRVIGLLLVLLLSALIVPMGIPVMPAASLASLYSRIPSYLGGEALLRWEDGRMHPLPQDFADMQGWDELADIVIRASDTIADKSRLFIYAENYGQAGAIEHFGRPHGLSDVVSFSDSYLLWIPDSLPPDKDLLIYVNDELGEDVDSLFAQCDSVGSVTNIYAREYGTTVYLCRSPKEDLNRFWTDRVWWVKQWYRLNDTE
jgi:hypothetical protein